MLLLSMLTNLIGLTVLILDVLAIGSILFGQSTLGHKISWTLVVLLLPVIGLLIYVVFGRSRRDVPLADL